MYFSTDISPHAMLVNPYDSYDVVPAGMPAFTPVTPSTLPQYSSLGRLQPEFLNYEVTPEGVDEDERPIIARGRTTRILGFAPREGWTGTRLTVRFLFRKGIPSAKVRLRVKMGNIPLRTFIRGIAAVDGVDGEWQLDVAAPDAVELDIVGLRVPLIVQVLDRDTAHIVDDVCIGSFQFKSCAPIAKSEFNVLDSMDLEKIEDDTEGTSPSSQPIYADQVGERVMPHRSGEIPLHPTDDSADTQSNAQAQAALYSARKRARLSISVPQDVAQNLLDDETSPEAASPTIVRNLQFPSSEKPVEGTYPATLTLRGDLDSMTKDWTDEEIENNRRVVEFISVRKRGNIDISFAPVGGEDMLDASRNVVSCIWWDDIGEFVITSVDTINLLERLVDTKFSTEEKNRIRRNLQGFKPATVSKNHPESKQFFQMLMEFPVPRPRNIEKDVKAFWWSKLESMLEKVVSKYWFVMPSPAGSDSEDQGSPPKVRVVRDPDSMSADSPSTVGLPLSAAQTPTSTQQSQSETHTLRSGTIPTSGYFMTTQSTPERSPLRPYVGTLGGSSYTEVPGMSTHDGSLYDAVDSLMEISESSMQELHNVQMSAGYRADLYHEQPGTYPDALGIPSNSMYGHDMSTSAGVFGDDAPVDTPFMTHTSQEYA